MMMIDDEWWWMMMQTQSTRVWAGQGQSLWAARTHSWASSLAPCWRPPSHRWQRASRSSPRRHPQSWPQSWPQACALWPPSQPRPRPPSAPCSPDLDCAPAPRRSCCRPRQLPGTDAPGCRGLRWPLAASKTFLRPDDPCVVSLSRVITVLTPCH